MKSGLTRFAVVAVGAALLTGCLFKSSTLPVRYFVLAPISTNEPAAAATEPLSVGIGLVKMPSYLLRDSLAVRNGANEIEYLEAALWGERLDQNFQRTLAANLSRLLASDRIYTTDWGRGQVRVRVYISVQQFEVDNHGHGTLVAQWRISPSDSDQPLKSGTARLDRKGASSSDPSAIAVNLSELTGEFSRELARAIRASAN